MKRLTTTKRIMMAGIGIDDAVIYEDAARNGFRALTFEQPNEAYEALYSDGLPDDKKLTLFLLWLFKFNDEFGGRGDKDVSACTQEMLARRTTVIQHLIELNQIPVFIAELYREIGEFDKCSEILEPIARGDSDDSFVARQILNQAKMKRTKVFRLEWP